jgi:hypothetical protein
MRNPDFSWGVKFRRNTAYRVTGEVISAGIGFLTLDEEH